MRCPNCGSFVEDSRTVCSMCGTPVSNYQNDGFNGMNNINNNVNNNPFGVGPNFNNDNNNFGGMNTYNSNNVSSSFSGNDFNGNPNANPNFTSGTSNTPSFGNGNDIFGSGSSSFDQNKRKQEYNKRFNNYKDVDFNKVKKEDRDLFDFFAENKKIITLALYALLIVVILFAGYKYNEYRNKDKTVEPVIMNLYYEVDSSLISTSVNNGVSYSKKGNNGDKGVNCSITISYGNAEDDHVKSYFNGIKSSLAAERDKNFNIINTADIYTSSESAMTINDREWDYLNMFYVPEKSQSNDPTHLKYRYMTYVYNGYYYNIELKNIKNDASCTASLNNFAKSLKLIDV